MRVERIRLQGFRNYESLDFIPAGTITVLTGENAQGKTNLLEAVYLCCVGRSHRTVRDQEMIQWGKPWAAVRLDTESRDGKRRIDVVLNRDAERKKIVKINQTQVQRIGEMMGQVNAVLFSPEDLKLVKEGPEGRRRFLDMEISQLYPVYFYALQRYAKALGQRNALLHRLEEEPSAEEILDDWDRVLAEAGAEIIFRRTAYLNELQAKAEDIHRRLTDGKETLRITYSRTECDGVETLIRLLKASRKEDIRKKSTGTGPHRDDMLVYINGHEARNFASQGQQRTAALSLKLAEVGVMRDKLGEEPVLLLDDVMSELDIHRRKMLLDRLDGIQTLLTCTHLSDLGGAAAEKICRVRTGALAEASTEG